VSAKTNQAVVLTTEDLRGEDIFGKYPIGLLAGSVMAWIMNHQAPAVEGEASQLPVLSRSEVSLRPGTFHGEDEIPSGTFHGEDELPPGTFH